MRTRSLGLTLFTGLALFVAACSNNAGTSPSASVPAASQPMASEPAASQPMASEPAASAPAASAPAEAPTCDTALKVGLVTDVGRVNDKGFNQSAYEGMLAAEEAAPTCFETDYIETTSQSDYATNIAQFTESGYDIVIGVGFLLGDALGDAAKANSRTPSSSASTASRAPGMTRAGPRTASRCSSPRTRRATWPACSPPRSPSPTTSASSAACVVVPPVERFVEGYINGAQGDQPRHRRSTSSTRPRSSIPPQGTAAAEQMIDAGADVIFAAGGLTGNGALLCGLRGGQASRHRRRHRPVRDAARGAAVPRLERDEEHRRGGQAVAAPHRVG